MRLAPFSHNHARLLVCAGIAMALAATQVSAAASPSFRLRLDHGHPWRPPFGLDRIGGPIVAIVEATAPPEPARYVLTSLAKGQELERVAVEFPGTAPYRTRVMLKELPDELVLSRVGRTQKNQSELARQMIGLPELEAAAIATADGIIHPVDLGTVLVPSGWLLLGPGQGGDT